MSPSADSRTQRARRRALEIRLQSVTAHSFVTVTHTNVALAIDDEPPWHELRVQVRRHHLTRISGRGKGAGHVVDDHGRFRPAVEMNRVSDAGIRSRRGRNLTHPINLSHSHSDCSFIWLRPRIERLWQMGPAGSRRLPRIVTPLRPEQSSCCRCWMIAIPASSTTGRSCSCARISGS